MRRRLFHWALGVGLARVRRAQAAGDARSRRPGWQDRLADRLVFSKIRARVGGRLRVLVSGSAPLPTTLAEFFAAAGLPILEGYGLTETSPVLTANPLRAAALRHASARPSPASSCASPADGEILARGPNVMRGYWNKPEATAEVLVDGWFHTGDVGATRRRRLSDDHRSQEGSARHLGRQEGGAAADRSRG